MASSAGKNKGASPQQQQGGDKAHSPGRKDRPQDRSPRAGPREPDESLGDLDKDIEKGVDDPLPGTTSVDHYIVSGGDSASDSAADIEIEIDPEFESLIPPLSPGSIESREQRKVLTAAKGGDPDYWDIFKKEVKARRLLAIFPRHKVFLWPMNGAGQRFRDLFRATWGRLPLWARRRVLGHWRNVRAHGVGMGGSPQIELTGWWSGRRGRGLRGDGAVVTCLGHVMRFHAPTVDRMPDPIVGDLIAHELAHVYQDACGVRPLRRAVGGAKYRDGAGDLCTAGDLEDWADDLAEQWGFSVTSIDEWGLEQGIVKCREVHDLSEIVKAEERFQRTGMRYSVETQ